MSTETIQEKKYRKWINTLPCFVCLMLDLTAIPPSEAHHQQKKGHGIMGGKISSFRCIPLCHHHHSEFHIQGRTFFSEKYNVEYEYIVESLNRIYGGIDG